MRAKGRGKAGAQSKASIEAQLWAQTLMDRAAELFRTGRHSEAEPVARQAAQVDAHNARAHNLIGRIAALGRQHEEARRAFQRAAELAPNILDFWRDLAVFYENADRLVEARECWENAVALDPKDMEMGARLIQACWRLNDIPGEVRYSDQVLSHHPEFTWARVRRGNALAAMGDWAGGLREIRNAAIRTIPNRFSSPRWDGAADVAGRTFLVHDGDAATIHRAGWGDWIMMTQLAIELNRRGARTIVECPNTIAPLLSTCPYMGSVISAGEPLPEFELHAQFWDLIVGLAISPDTPPCSSPYLTVEEDRVGRWRGELAGVKGFRVGICWHGNPNPRLGPIERFFPLEALRPLAEVPRIRLVALQKGAGREQLAAFGSELGVIDFDESSGLNDGSFLDTAAVMMNLDLIVTADTAVAHLAGALGRPVWIALHKRPDWRWFSRSAPDRTRWYPTARLFHQIERDGWSSVFQRMAAELRAALSREAMGSATIRGASPHHTAKDNGSPAEVLVRRPSPAQPTTAGPSRSCAEEVAEPAHADEIWPKAGGGIGAQPQPESDGSMDIAAVFSTAMRWHQENRLEEAQSLYQQILARHHQHAGALHLSGVVCHQQGENQRAIELIARAIALVPDRAIYWSNYGAALKALGRIDEAVGSFSKAVKLRPDYATAQSNLGLALHVKGNLAAARAALEAAVRLDGDSADAHFNLGNVLRELGEDERAVVHFQTARKLAPARSDVRTNLGLVLYDLKRDADAIASLGEAQAIAPKCADTLLQVGRALAQSDRHEEAAGCYTEAARLQPSDPFWAVRIAALCPVVFPNVEAIDRYRDRLEAALDARAGAGLRWDTDDPGVAGCVPSFNLAHHGRDERTIREKFAAMYRDPAPRPEAGSGDRPPRIGFVVTHPHEGVFLRCMSGLIERLNPRQFEPIILGSRRGIGALRRGISRPDISFVGLSGGFASIVRRIRDVRCDILYYWEVGTDPLNYRLPFARLAPVQCTSWGIQATSGVAAVDYYLSSELVEPLGAERHYAETLIRLPALLSYQRRTAQADPRPTRSEFGLPDGAPLYACLQRPLKIHPAFDPILGEILRRDRRGLVLLLADRNNVAGPRLRERFRATMPDVAERIVLMPPMDASRYHRLLSLAEVALDPQPYGCGSSCYDFFSHDIPLVTLPGSCNAGRYALACYRRMGLTEPVANSPEAYVDLAARLATDPDYRAAVRSQIANASPVLFEDAEVVRSFEGFVESAISAVSGSRLRLGLS